MSNLLKLPKEIARVEGACWPQETARHFYVAESPPRPGLQALLIVTVNPSGMEEFRDVLAVLPQSVPGYKNYTDRLHSAWLGESTAFYKRYLTAEKEMGLFRNVESCSWSDSPFALEAVGMLGLRLDKLEEQVRDAGVEALAESVRAVRDNCFDETRWAPFHLLEACVRTDNLEILSKWRCWESRSLTIEKCAAEYFGKAPDEDELEAFRVRLRRMNLFCPRKTPIPHRWGGRRRRGGR